MFPDNNHHVSDTLLNDTLKTIAEYNSFCDESTGVEWTCDEPSTWWTDHVESTGDETTGHHWDGGPPKF